MSEPPLPPTSLTLLAALRQGLRWEEFVALYGRLVLHWCRHRFGLQEADAEDVRQELLLKVWRYLGSYDPARGRFRAWLYRCTGNALSDLLQRRSAREGQAAEEALAALPAPPPGPWPQAALGGEEDDLEGAVEGIEEEGFDEERLQQAILQVRDRVACATWKAFLLSVCLDLSGQDVADRLGMSPVSVYQAVCRVRRMIQQAAAQERVDDPPQR
jgi:RNA polymerase sigma-70 factor (ECF subfamily)